jgi:hypothetical protein
MISLYIAYNIFYPIYVSDEIIIPYGVTPFDICEKYPVFWKYLKIIFILCYLFSNLIFSNFIYNRFFNKFIFNKNNIPKNIINKNKKNNDNLNLLIGENINKQKIYIPKSGLFQNILITRNNRIRKNKFCNVSIF